MKKVEGEIGRYRFSAQVLQKGLHDGLNPLNLYKGGGRIISLYLYENHQGIYIKVAAYQRGWLFGRKKHEALLRRLVNYLEEPAALAK